MTETYNYPDTYMSVEGKQMVKNTKVTIGEGTALIEVERIEIPPKVKAQIQRFVNSRLAYKDRKHPTA